MDIGTPEESPPDRQPTGMSWGEGVTGYGREVPPLQQVYAGCGQGVSLM